MKTLNKILTIGTASLTLLLGGCSESQEEYECNGKIGEDQVEFSQRLRLRGWGYDDNVLSVTKPDGRVIEYCDSVNEDLKLEGVQITKNENTTFYGYDEIGKPILEEAQKQFDSYLSKIKEEKIRQGLENLK